MYKDVKVVVLRSYEPVDRKNTTGGPDKICMQNRKTLCRKNTAAGSDEIGMQIQNQKKYRLDEIERQNQKRKQKLVPSIPPPGSTKIGKQNQYQKRMGSTNLVCRIKTKTLQKHRRWARPNLYAVSNSKSYLSAKTKKLQDSV